MELFVNVQNKQKHENSTQFELAGKNIFKIPNELTEYGEVIGGKLI